MKKILPLFIIIILATGAGCSVAPKTNNTEKESQNVYESSKNVEDEIKEAFYKKNPTWEKDKILSFTIGTLEGNYAIGKFVTENTIENNVEGFWYASKVNGEWVVLDHSFRISYAGNCQDFWEYGFPKELIPDCWDNDKKILINTANPDKFYVNGFTVDDKEKIKEAFLKYNTRDFYKGKELFVIVSKNTQNHLSGTVLVGGIDNFSAPYFLGFRDGDEWVVVYNGQDIPPCKSVLSHNFPNTMIDGCWDEESQKFVEME